MTTLDNFVIAIFFCIAAILALFLIAVVFRLIAKVIFKTFFEERSKYEHEDKTRKNRQTKE